MALIIEFCSYIFKTTLLEAFAAIFPFTFSKTLLFVESVISASISCVLSEKFVNSKKHLSTLPLALRLADVIAILSLAVPKAIHLIDSEVALSFK